MKAEVAAAVSVWGSRKSRNVSPPTWSVFSENNTERAGTKRERDHPAPPPLLKSLVLCFSPVWNPSNNSPCVTVGVALNCLRCQYPAVLIPTSPFVFSSLLLVNLQPVKVSQGSTYSELLSVIEEMSREIRPTYAGSKSAMERLKRGATSALILLSAKLFLVWGSVFGQCLQTRFRFAASNSSRQPE